MRRGGVSQSWVRIRRAPAWFALAIAVMCFMLTAAVGCVPVIVAFIALLNPPESSLAADVNMFLLTTVFSCAVGIPAYIITRYVYTVVRWKRVPDEGPICAACGYNLTGNLSGVCPECGEPI